MSRRIKKFASSLGLRSGSGDVQESQRNVTPPSSANPADLNTTPPQQINLSNLDGTPADVNILTPPTPPPAGDRARQIKPKASLIDKILGTSFKQSINAAHPNLLEEGLTGSDPSLPLFDGTSQNPIDHLIDVDTPSMERYPDVRLYFYLVGRALDKPETPERPSEYEARRLYDDRMVGEGRDYLKLAKARGNGYFLSSERDVLGDNQPDNRWYRLATIGVVDKIVNSAAHTTEVEGYLHNTDKDWEVLDSGVLSTNIRVPILWAECYREGVKPGTKGWDNSIESLYMAGSHPAYQVMAGSTWDEIIFDLMTHSAAAGDAKSACLRPEVERILRRDWPNIKRPYFRSEHTYEGPGLNNVPNNTMRQFLGLAPP